MKRTKSFLAGLCTLVLTLTLAFGTVAYFPVFADGATTADEPPVATAETAQFTGIKSRSTVNYGDTIAVPDVADATVEVIAPNGNKATVTANAVKADQLGNYTVKYTKSGLSYSYRVYCAYSEDLELAVPADAKIPSYIKTNEKVRLPKAEVGFYDEEGKWVALNADDYSVAVYDSRSNTPIESYADNDYTFGAKGSVFLTYSATVKGGANKLTKTYEVKVQDDFEDKKAPTLTVSGVPTSGNVNKVVTLPVATASDSFDERVEVSVKVTGLDKNGELNPVKKSNVDDNGIAYGDELEGDEVFDNNKNMTFYPRRAGEYKVVYQATDDAGNTSAEWTYTVTVSDKNAPVITVDENAIPAKWGKTVKYLANNDATEDTVEANASITFPFPEVYDNSDKPEDIVLGFTIRDPENRTVVNFSNINKAAGEDGTKYTNSITDKEYAFNKTAALSFNFGEHINAVKDKHSEYITEGDYVVTYTAEDEAGNRSTKTYTINVVETFEDDSVVTVEFNNVDKYVVADADETVKFTVPTPVYSSANDSKLALTYSIQVGADDTKKFTDLKGGEVIEIKKVTDGYTLTLDDKEIKVTESIELTLSASAKSDAGNTGVAADQTVQLIIPDGTALFTVETTAFEGMIVAGHTNAERVHNIGSFVIKCNEDVKHVGVELGVKTADGQYLNDISAEIYHVGATKVVRNLSFATLKAGDYFAELRVFDINGHSDVYIQKITIAEADKDDETTASAALNTATADVNSKIMLANEKLSVAGLKGYMDGNTDYTAVLAHVVNGGRFSLMGEEFTALTTGKYSVTDKPVVVKNGEGNETKDYDLGNPDKQAALDNFLAGLAEAPSYLTVSDNETVRFELQGNMPSYKELDSVLDLSGIKGTAFTSNGNADVTYEVKSPSGSKVTSVDNGDNKEKFKLTAHGTYTVTYTAKLNGKETTFDYSIKVGDVVAPTFSLLDAPNGKEATHETTVKSGYEFSFLVINAEDDRTSAGSLTYTKKVIGPDGEVVGTTISGTGSTYANRTEPTSGKFKLDASGKYTVVYTVKDEAGNETTKEYEITVTNSTKSGGISLAALSAILIIVGVLLIVGVVVYLFRFRRVKKG